MNKDAMPRRVLGRSVLGLCAAAVVSGCPRAQQVKPVFDSHLHIIDPRFPLVENQGYLPRPFPLADYLTRARPLGVAGGAVVSGSFHGLTRAICWRRWRSWGQAGWVSRRQQPGAPAYCTDLTRGEMRTALAAADKPRLPKRRDLSVAVMQERLGDGTTNPDEDWGVRLVRAINM